MGEWTKKKRLTIAWVFVLWVSANLFVMTPIAGGDGLLTHWEGDPKGSQRRNFVLAPEGCKKSWQCPGIMECRRNHRDYEYKKMCSCDSFYHHYLQPPAFDSAEAGPKFNVYRDCRPLWIGVLWSTIWWGLLGLSCVRLSQYSIQTLFRVVKNNDKFTWNSTARTLFWLIASSFWNAFIPYVILLVVLGLDPDKDILESTWGAFMGPMGSKLSNFLYYEMPITWIDLVLKTVNMTQRSTRTAIFFKYFFYAWLLMRTVFQNIIPWSDEAKEWYDEINDITDYLILTIPGVILGRLLCKNMKDTSNPNWKVARIIHRTWITSIAVSLTLDKIINPQFIKWQFYGIRHLEPFGNTGYCLYKSTGVTLDWMYLHYILFGFRKYLQEYDTDRVSQYFGFSMVGIKSVVSCVVSSWSGRSSTESRASVAAVSSADGGDGKETA